MNRKPSMPKGESVDVEALRKALEAAFPDGRWLRLLEVFLPTGVADYGQMQRVTGLSRDQMDVLLERLAQLGGGSVVRPYAFGVPRPGVRGRPAVVYGLGEAGAALLRAAGHREAAACGYEEVREVAHARAVLDVRLAAEAAGLSVRTEAELVAGGKPGEGGHRPVLRPDNVVTLPNGVQALYEVEQEADLSLLRRVVESLRRKAAFFGAVGGGKVSRVVRVVYAVAPERLERTVGVWERGLGLVVEEVGGPLPFRLVGMTLGEFLERPDWSEPPDEGRWRGIEPGSRGQGAGSRGQGGSGGAGGKEGALAVRGEVPAALLRRSPADDRRILAAYWQWLQERGPEVAYTEEHPRPDPVFFEVMGVIYAASHGEGQTVVRRAAYPYASVYLLGKYLEMHPKLRGRLRRVLERGRETMRWNVTTILHRMQGVIREFLRYHGYEVGRWLLAVPESSWERGEGPQDFGVRVRIHPEVLMGEGDGVVPGQEAVARAEEALAWVLWALFAYAEEIGLKAPPFW
jgi:hypothetical protein